MEINEDIVIVGAGLSGLCTALALHRLGLRSIVLESSDSLRFTGFALTLWTNAWRALDAVGVGDILRKRSVQTRGFRFASGGSFLASVDLSLGATVKSSPECRCVRRKELLEILAKELPQGTIRCSSKVVSIDDSEHLKLVHLADGCLIKTKVLIGCDGVNSVVGQWLGLQKPVDSGRAAIRGFVQYPEGHGFEPDLHVYFDAGVRYGFVPCDVTSLYWFCTFTPVNVDDYEDMEQNPLKMKQFVLDKTKDAPKEVSDIVQRTELQSLLCTRLKLRLPWNLILGDIVKNNVCVAGDALHPMTPDIGQGGCSALEDGVVLARCLAEALLTKPKRETGDEHEGGILYGNAERGLENYAKQRRWRSVSLITTAYVVGFIQESNGKVMSFLKEKFLKKYITGKTSKMADFDCGKLIIS